MARPGCYLGDRIHPLSRDSRVQQNIRIAVLIGTLALGSVSSILVMPTVFPEIPTTIARVETIMRVIAESRASPRLVVFGNSIAMSGIDSTQLARESGHPGPAYNLAYQGQSLVECYLVQQSLHESVETIVQLVMIESKQAKESLLPQKYNNLYMWGYRPPAAAIEKLHEIYGSAVSATLEASDLSQRFGARWAIQQFADIKIRRRDADPRNIQYINSNLHLPAPFPHHDPQLNRRVRRRAAGFTGETYRLGASEQQLIQAMVDESRAAGRQLVIVFAPVHPTTRAMLLKDDLRALAAYGKSLSIHEHVTVLDATSVLTAEDFYDEIHVARSGARRLTSLIANSMAPAH
jgi:hypothetical protein